MKRNIFLTLISPFETFFCRSNYSKKFSQLSGIILFSSLLFVTQFSFSQSSTCTPGTVENASDDLWSEECYLDASCLEQGNPCTANDINLIDAFLADEFGNSIGAFNCDNGADLYLWGTFVNGTGTDRYAVRTRTEVWLDGVLEIVINECSFDVLPPGTADALLLGPYTFTCAQEINLLYTWVGWETSAAQCEDPLLPNYNNVCGEYAPSKCSKDFDPIIVQFPSFTSDCGAPLEAPNAVEICFDGHASGGVLPYSYYWDFGDGTFGSIEDICHTFYTTMDNSFTVVLTITDSSVPPLITEIQSTLTLPYSSCPPDIEISENGLAFNIGGASGYPVGGTGVYYYSSGGTYYTPDAPITSFDPSVAGLGVHTISHEYTYNGCAAHCYFNITVLGPAPAVPVSNWALILGIGLMLVAALFIYRRIMN